MHVADDIRVLTELSSLHRTLLQRSRQSEAIKGPMRALRGRVGELAARIEVHTRRLAQAPARDGPEDPEALRSELETARIQHDQANRELDRALFSAKGELETIAAETDRCSEQARALSQQLSSEGLRVYRELTRLGRLPFVASLERDRCEACHLRVPTAFAGAMARRRGLHRCPFCKRVFVPEGNHDIAA